MKVLDPIFQATLAQESTYIAWCWHIERVDGVILGFTSFDLNLVIDGVVYEPFTGFTPTADSSSEGLQNNNSQDLAGLLTEEQISADDLLKGKFKEAKITCFQVDVTDLPITIDSSPRKCILKYQRYIKRAIISDLGFRFELRDDDWLFEAKIGKPTSKFCYNDLGDDRCGVDLALYTYSRKVVSVANRYQFNCDGTHTLGQFNRGKITFLTGANAGVSRDIFTFEAGNLITLFQPVPYSISLDDEIELIQGCGKTLYDCVVYYNNAKNSDSEPHIPTLDRAINTPIE